MMYVCINLSRPVRSMRAGQQGRHEQASEATLRCIRHEYEQASKADAIRPVRPCYIVYVA